MQWRLRFVHRETVLLVVLVVIAAAAFVLTRAMARKNHDVRLRDAATWHERALRDLEAGRPELASTALRRAVATDPGSHRYQLELARALAASTQHAQARQVLLRLREQRPEDADVNLELARLEAGGVDEAAAVRYYEHALAALWSDQHTETRQRVRMEMIEFLLHLGQRRRALAELLVLSPSLPDEAAIRTRVGRMFLDVGDPRRALDQFSAALRLAADDGPALAGAGEAAFAIDDYARARQYLARAPESLPQVRELREIVEFVLTRDPLAPRIGASERRRRLVANLEDVTGRLASCAGPAAGALLEEVEALSATLGSGARPVARDVAEEGLDAIVRIEVAMEDACGPPTPLDQALVLIARRHNIGPT
jgi:tetratricopeptide (TPR) repeat protein